MGHTLSAKEIPSIQGMPGTLQNIPFADFLKRIHAAKQEEEKREKIRRLEQELRELEEKKEKREEEAAALREQIGCAEERVRGLREEKSRLIGLLLSEGGEV